MNTLPSFCASPPVHVPAIIGNRRIFGFFNIAAGAVGPKKFSAKTLTLRPLHSNKRLFSG